MGCGVSNSTSTRSDSAALYCKTCGSGQTNALSRECTVCGTFDRFRTPTRSTAPDLERTGSFSLGELQRSATEGCTAGTNSGINAVQPERAEQPRGHVAIDGEQSPTEDKIEALVSGAIEGAIKRMNAVDEEAAERAVAEKESAVPNSLHSTDEHATTA